MKTDIDSCHNASAWSRQSLRPPCRLAIVVPCYNEEEAFPLTNDSLLTLLSMMAERGLTSRGSRVVYVDDGSSDATWRLMEAAVSRSPEVAALRLACNAGHQNALMAGMALVDDCGFDAVVTVDADLQDDISVIPDMVEAWRAGADVVYGVRRRRDSDSWFKRVSASAFYRLLRSLGVITVGNHSDFRLLGRRALSRLLRYGERNLYLRGIMPLLGGRQVCVGYDRKPRSAGRTKYPFGKMLNFAIDGITSFTVRPVRMISVVGIIFVVVALGVFIYTMIRHFQGETIEGWTSLMLSIWFCSGVLLMALGVIGEYVGKIYTESKHRPRYVVDGVVGLESFNGQDAPDYVAHPEPGEKDRESCGEKPPLHHA